MNAPDREMLERMCSVLTLDVGRPITAADFLTAVQTLHRQHGPDLDLSTPEAMRSLRDLLRRHIAE